MKKNPKDKVTGGPKSYYKGLSKDVKKDRKRHFDRTSKMDDNDPTAYQSAPGDVTAKTRLSKHTKAYRDKFGEKLEMEDVLLDETAETGLAAKAKKSGVSIGTLRKVYNRGMAAWRTGHRPGTTPQQWAMARVNSYITKGKGTYYGADKDLRETDQYTNNIDEGSEPESFEAGYKRRVVGTTSDDHKKRGFNWRIKGKERPEISIKLYKEKPSQQEFNKQMRRVAGHEFGEEHTLKNANSKLDEKCWTGYKRVGMKKKGNRRVPNCVPESINPNLPKNRLDGSKSLVDNYKNNTPGQTQTVKTIKRIVKEAAADAKGYKSSTGGLTQKGRDHYNRKSGGNLQAPVTKEPSKLKPGSKAANRRKSFCARMGGMKKKLTSVETARDPESRINKALRKWNC